MFKYALVSVSDKTGLIALLTPLVERGLQIVSTGGTFQYIQSHGLPVQEVSDVTNFPEILDGRVKTLHPLIHMSLLARMNRQEDREVLKEWNRPPFDLVIGNLYPFEQAASEKKTDLIEWIDVGGPSFLRAAAKNYESIAVVSDPSDYEDFLNKAIQGEITLDYRKKLARKVFLLTSYTDAMIAQSLGSSIEDPFYILAGKKHQALRYGENPQQSAVWYKTPPLLGPGGLEQLSLIQGKELSYNNLLDLHHSLSTLSEWSPNQPCAVIVKHNNPCGVAIGTEPSLALKKALHADPLSSFGGVLAVNSPFQNQDAELIKDLFLECVVAPSFSSEALDGLKKKKNLRIIQFNSIQSKENKTQSIQGGFLVQTTDCPSHFWKKNWICYGKETPNEQIKNDLLFAWKVSAHLKSNGIALASQGQSRGLGMGQVNRVDSVKQALERMKRFHLDVTHPVLASDGFFPFSDSLDLIAQAGVQWIIQPGGSIKDKDIIQRSHDLGLNMIITGERHFLH